MQTVSPNILGLSPFEHYMLMDDSQNYPMTCGIRFFMSGVMDKAALSASFQEESLGHPLFSASTDGVLWELAPPLSCRVDFFDRVEDPLLVRNPFNLRELGPLTRLHILVFSDAHDHHIIEMRFHHATCDGMAIFEFFERSLIRYQSKEAGDPHGLTPLTTSLSLRDDPPPAGLANAWQRMKRHFRFFSRIPVAIKQRGLAVPGTTAVPGQSAERIMIAAGQLRVIRQVAKKNEVSLNDWLLGALFRTLLRTSGRGLLSLLFPVRVAVATSLREPHHLGMSACNVVSMVFLDRSLGALKSVKRLVRSIAAEMGTVKRWRLGSSMVEVFRHTMSVPGLSQLLLATQRRSATAVLTNLGVPFRDRPLNDASGRVAAAGLVLESLETWPPVRRGTALAISVNTYGGVLSVTGRFDPNVVSGAYARQILTMFTDEALAMCGHAEKEGAGILNKKLMASVIAPLLLCVMFSVTSTQVCAQDVMEENQQPPVPTEPPPPPPSTQPQTESPPADQPTEADVRKALEPDLAPPEQSTENIGATVEQPVTAEPPAAEVLAARDEYVWLPDWPTPPFGWSVSPVAAFKYGLEESPLGGRMQVSTAEGGVSGSINYIPIVTGQPGWWVSPFAGTGFGYVKVTGDDVSDLYHYQRSWIGFQNRVMFGPLKYDLAITRGRLDYPEKRDWLTQDFGIGNDFGVLLLDWLSAHYTLNYHRSFHNQFDLPFLSEYDNWVHARSKFKVMDLVVDIGPGLTLSKAWEPDSEDLITEGITRYVKSTVDFDLWWGLGGTGMAKYAFDSSQSRLGKYDRRRLPMEELNQSPTVTMPEDSFQGSLFLGFKEIIFGIGFGWRYNIEVYSFGGRHDRERETTTDQGFGFYKEVRF